MAQIAARLEAMPYSGFHRRLLIMGGLGYAFDGFDSALLAFIYPVLAKTWNLDPITIGFIGSATFVGFFFGAIVAGFAADVVGRKPVMMAALIVYTTFSLASAFCQDWRSFFVLRLLAGLGIGAESAIIAPYLAEFVSSRYRGLFTGSLASFFSFGFAGAALAAAVLLTDHPQRWRVLLAVSALPVFLFFWWRRALPESPRWLVSRGRVSEADAIVRRMELDSGSVAASVPAEISSQLVLTQPPSRGFDAMRLLFSRRLIGVTLMSWSTWLAITSCYYAFFTWLPSLVIANRLGGSKPALYTTLIYAAQIPGYFSAAFMNEWIGRRATIVTYMTAGAFAALCFAAARTPIEFLLTGAILSFAMNGSYAGIYAYTPELFPTRVRATGAGVASAVGRLGAIASPVLVPVIYSRFGLTGVFGATTGVLLVGVAAVLVLGISTKNRAFEHIEAEEYGLTSRELPS